MKVFLSWSGELSRQVALALRDWIPCVIQRAKPYVSSEDIHKGNRWVSNIAKELERSSHGIICVTHENLEAPWLHFEAGALSKSFEKSKVAPLLLNIDPELVKGPLQQFQLTKFAKDEINKLI